jgi:glycosyltransferase involved in cell wall biosynthesis
VSESIVHVSFSSAGGAGSVAKILSDEQTRQGMKSSVLSVISSDLRAAPWSAPLHTLAAGVDEYLVKSPGFRAPISLLRDAAPGLELAIPSDADIIHLHGINGAVTIDALTRIGNGRKIVWTLHDMNPFTGACHYSLGCAGFVSDCSSCPAVKAPFRGSVKRHLAKKIEAIEEIPGLSLVAPSSWLAELARNSATFRNHDISVIPNPVNPTYLQNEDDQVGDGREKGFRAMAIAKNLSDPVKAIDIAVSAFHEATRGIGDAQLSLVGGGGETFAGPNINLRGQLNARELARELSHCDVLIVPSRAENAPLVIAEAAARGCIPLVADVGGMREMITSLGHGETFSHPEELASLLEGQIKDRAHGEAADRRKIAQSARAAFSPEVIVARYGKVYEGKE